MSAAFHSNLSSMRGAYDVIVVGGGIVGLSTAFFLERKGLRVCVVERLPTPASLTSRRSGEGVRAQWVLPHNIEIARASIAFYRDFPAHIGIEGHSSGYRPIGYLYASRTEEGAARLAERTATQVANGLDDVEYLDGDAVRARFPLLAGDVQGGAFRAGDGIVVVSEIVAGYIAAIKGDVLLGADVTAVHRNGDGYRVETDLGTLRAPAVVLANGARLPTMLSDMGIALPLRIARSSILHVKTEGIPYDHPATVDVDLGSFWRPDTGGARITASFRNTLFLERFTDDPFVDPDYLGHAIATVSPLVPVWRDVAPTIADSHARHGTFAVSGDGGPLIGQVADVPGLYINGAYGGHGIMMSPDGARRLADAVAGDDVQPDPFAPSRFAGGHMPPPEPMTVNTNDAARETP